MRFPGKGVFVTGASGGLGAATALGFAREGAIVFVGYRSGEDRAQAVAAKIHEDGGVAHVIAIDVRDDDSVAAAFKAARATGGNIDVLVNNAGIARDGWATMVSTDDFRDVVEVNLTGAFRCAKAVMRGMMARKSGTIVNIGSVAGLHASPGQVSYSASKGGLVALTRTLAAELAPRGIRVNAVVPGLVEAGMAQRLDHKVVAERKASIPLGRFATADEFVEVVLFVASDAASYIVGQALVVDGGLTL